MKVFSIVCLGLLAVASAGTLTDYDNKGVTVDIKDKQLVILKLLNNVIQPLMYKDLEEIGRTYKIEDNLEKYMKVEVVKDFLELVKIGMLPRGEVFTLNIDRQMKEVVRTFHLLYYAKDFTTFIKTACWLRLHLNEGMFVYALTVAVRHRLDCKDIVLPAPYEIYPYYFVRADVIQKAYLLKMQKGMIDDKVAHFYGIRKDNKGVYVIEENVYDSRVYLSTEDRLRYFTEDIDLNTYYYYFHVDLPFWMKDDILDKTKTRRWELTLYMYQQILARYYLERLSCDLGPIETLSWHKKVKVGYWPWMKLHNGVELPVRMNDKYLLTEKKIDILRVVESYENIIKEAIFKGFVEVGGMRLELTKPEDIEVLGKLIYGTIDKKDIEFETKDVEAYRYLLVLMKAVLGLNTVTSDKYFVTPTVLDSYQTALRDPVFYQLQKRIVDLVIIFKRRLPAYTKDDLLFPGVKIEKVIVDKLLTYFDEYLMDMTNAVYRTDSELKKTIPDESFFVRKLRLNHKPFTVTLDIISDKAVDSIVRIFLGPKRNHVGKIIDLNKNRLNFVEIDTFVRKLDVGKNTIVRKSVDMHNIIRDRILTRDIFTKIESTSDVKDLMRRELLHYNTGFPVRLLLPKGKVGGLEMMLYVIVSPLKLRENVDISKMDLTGRDLCKDCRFAAVIDKMPLGFPFDRHIDLTKFFTPNTKFVDVVVFHKKTVCDMKTRWERYVLRQYNLVDRVTTAGTYFDDTEIDNIMEDKKDRVIDTMFDVDM